MRFSDNDLFADAIENEYMQNEILSRYYYKTDRVRQATYLTYLGDSDSINNILILTEEGAIIPLEDYSPIVAGLLQSGQKEERKIFYGKPKFKL